MEAMQFCLAAILFIGIVYGNENATVTRKKQDGHPNVTKKVPVHPNSARQFQEDTGTDLRKNPGSNSSEPGNTSVISVDSDEGWEFENKTPPDTRRILNGKKVQPGARPYMVYLHLTPESAKAAKNKGWLCGGVIVHQDYVMTSAACVEDADRFYIIAGTVKYLNSYNYTRGDECIYRNKRKVVWKCVPKNYKFDFFDSVKWSANDIAIVKVDRPFALGEVEEGCQFAANSVPYNNISRELEEPGTKGFILGWGSGESFREGVYRKQNDEDDIENKYGNINGEQNKNEYNAEHKCLQEAKVCLMDTTKCAVEWTIRFREIIKEYMICTKDFAPEMSVICSEKYANCTTVQSRRELTGNSSAKNVTVKDEKVDLGRHLRDPNDYTARRSPQKTGGFCENDHGGPLVVRYQGVDHVVGVISACKIDPETHLCHGPFLYTSVFANRQFLSCSINKDIDESCRRVFRTGITHDEWTITWDDQE